VDVSGAGALPDAGKRFMSLMVVNEDQFVPMVAYDKGTYTIDKAKAGTRYDATAIRTLVDPANPEDVKQVHALQDAIKVQKEGDRLPRLHARRRKDEALAVPREQFDTPAKAEY
jgi:hypothetical protein